MNLYVRYFDEERIVATPEDAYQFLCQATNEHLDEYHLEQLQEYASSSVNFTKRFKIRSRVYYVAIKTDVATLEEFKQRGQQMKQEHADTVSEKKVVANVLTEEKPGWYEGKIIFKRVVFNVDSNKNEYVDTEFVAKAKARSPQHLYERICDYLHSRPDMDPRSQMPSIKGKNFQYKYLD